VQKKRRQKDHQRVGERRQGGVELDLHLPERQNDQDGNDDIEGRTRSWTPDGGGSGGSIRLSSRHILYQSCPAALRTTATSRIQGRRSFYPAPRDDHHARHNEAGTEDMFELDAFIEEPPGAE